jgi:hypothetical protein
MNKLPFIVCAAVAAISLACGIASAEGAAVASTTATYSVPTLFNSGNEAARAGKPALAVLDYERALLLAPDDADVRANLLAVQASAGIAPTRSRWLDRYDRLAAPNLMYWLGMLGLVLGGGSLLAYRLRLPGRKPLAMAAIIGAAMTVLSIGDAVATAPVLNAAVVMQASPASASPVVGAEPQFTVPAAEVIHIRDQHQGFLLIKDSQNREGWIPRSNVTPVIPEQERRLADG